MHKSGLFPQIQVDPVYFNRQDVKVVVHVPPNVQWMECSKSPVFIKPNTSAPLTWDILPQLMKQGIPVIVVTGLAGYLILSKGSSYSI